MQVSKSLWVKKFFTLLHVKHLFRTGDAFVGRMDCFGWANQDAEVTAHTFCTVQDGLAFIIELDGLMTAIGAGDFTAPTAKAFCVVKFWEKDGISFEDVR